MENVYQHFRKDEQAFIDSAIDWAIRVNEQFSPYLTPFLDPRQLFILDSIVGQYPDVFLHQFGGYEHTERKRIYLAPSYFEPTIEDYEITLVEINYPTKFAELSHGQILGSLLGAGIKREMLGDIFTDGARWQFFADNRIFSYLLTEVDKVGKVKVHLERKTTEELIQTIDNWNVRTEIVSSLRLDVVLAGVFHLSRGRVKELVSSGRVKINWVETTHPDIELDMRDILSIRGFGRIQIQEIQGRTKKDKYVLDIGVLDRNQ